ncbi:tRNA(Met)-cytidine N(4)-acetyltransferase [Enterobacter cloacae]|uniref:tRNA(Met)-cytidine N(4)-acetyltransferase n=1 Tax=Enterobacter cloacae TaxID=550 RepID=A0A377LVM8_ENTCL|nr:tRNA(Met)-cytidine N(4)-acetyltransferase [Enterobacter cloacae]
MVAFDQLISQLERTGQRRLVVLSGDAQWSLAQAGALRDTLSGDWVWLDENPSREISGLLGREFRHAVFDARVGFDVSAFAALSGTLRAGSLLVLLAPRLRCGQTRPTVIPCAGATARNPSPRRISFATFVRRLPATPMQSSGSKTSR